MNKDPIQPIKLWGGGGGGGGVGILEYAQLYKTSFINLSFT